MPTALSSALRTPASPVTTTGRGLGKALRDLASLLLVGLLAIPHAAMLGGVFLLGRWDALRQRLARG